MTRLRALLTVLYLSSLTCYAQTIPSDREDLEGGAGAGMAKYADLNGYPGPKHILELEDTLRLNSDQRFQIVGIFNHMKSSAVGKGKLIIEKEQQLELLFRTEKASEQKVKRLAADIGRLRGELRAEHLNAHIKARRILTKQQVALYDSLRHGTTRLRHEAH